MWGSAMNAAKSILTPRAAGGDAKGKGKGGKGDSKGKGKGKGKGGKGSSWQDDYSADGGSSYQGTSSWYDDSSGGKGKKGKAEKQG